MGSAVHARSLKAQQADVKLAISLEMIGYFSTDPDSQDYPLAWLKLFYPSTGHFIAVVDQLWSSAGPRLKSGLQSRMSLPVYSINAPTSLRGIDFSDHRSYWQVGYPAVMITDTAFFRNRTYHTSGDTPERLDYQKMAQIVDALTGYIVEQANH